MCSSECEFAHFIAFQKDQSGLTSAPANDDDWRLYDLSKDIGEENDIAGQHPDIVARIRGLLKRDKFD